MKYLTFYRKETLYTLGYVADFCPIEGKITVERIDAVHASRYLNFFRIDKGPFLRADRCCCACGITIPDERHPYAMLAPAADMPAAVLEKKTNPGVSERNRDFIELRCEIEGGAHVESELKSALLKEQFAWLERIAAQQWTGETTLDRFSVVFGLVSLAVLFAGLVIVPKLVPEPRRLDAIGVVFGAGLLLLAVNAFVFFLAPRRAIKKRVLPLMAIALRPLKPSRLELDALLAEMRAEGFQHATKVKSTELLQLIQRV